MQLIVLGLNHKTAPVEIRERFNFSQDRTVRVLRRLRNKKGIILVSHRESTMAIADRVYGVKNGRMFPLPRAGREERM